MYARTYRVGRAFSKITLGCYRRVCRKEFHCGQQKSCVARHKPLFARRKPDRKVLKLPEQGRRAHSPGPGWGRATEPPALIAEVRDDTKLAGCDPPCKDPISYAGKLASGWGGSCNPMSCQMNREARSEKKKKRKFEGFKRVRSVSRCDYRHLSLPLSPPPRF